MSKLVEYHEADDPDVYRWSELRAMVKLSGFCVTLVPFDGAESVPDGDVPDIMRRSVNEFLETPASALGSIRFGALSTWANRRMSARHSYRCDADECDHRSDEWRPDNQSVLGAIFNRYVIRESLQWLYQHGVDADAMVDVRKVPTPPPVPGEERLTHVLVMRCGEWTGVVMCCRHDTEHGSDPLFPEVTNG